jgi:FkbM family methyltransferase
MIKIAKQAVRRALAQFGYSVRHVGAGSSVTGVDMLEDIRVRLGNPASPMLFDVGANIGQTIDQFRAAYASPRIIAFEPSPTTFVRLQQSHRHHAGVQLEQLAMGDVDGRAVFYVMQDHSVNDSLLAPKFDDRSEEVIVQVRTVDDYCASTGIDTVDLLKIDAQGFDLKVIEGASRMLSMRRIRHYSVEVMFTDMYAGQATLGDFLAQAERHGYRLLGVYEQMFSNNHLWYFNACFEPGRPL